MVRGFDQLAMARGHGDEVEPLAGLGLGDEPDVLAHGQAGKQVGQLERPPQPEVGAGRGGGAGDVAPLQQHLAGGRGQLAGDQVEIGGLARPVGADDGGQLPRPEGAGDAVHRDMPAEADGQGLRLEDGIGQGKLRREVCGFEKRPPRSRAPEAGRRRSRRRGGRAGGGETASARSASASAGGSRAVAAAGWPKGRSCGVRCAPPPRTSPGAGRGRPRVRPGAPGGGARRLSCGWGCPCPRWSARGPARGSPIRRPGRP